MVFINKISLFAKLLKNYFLDILLCCKNYPVPVTPSIPFLNAALDYQIDLSLILSKLENSTNLSHQILPAEKKEILDLLVCKDIKNVYIQYHQIESIANSKENNLCHYKNLIEFGEKEYKESINNNILVDTKKFDIDFRCKITESNLDYFFVSFPWSEGISLKNSDFSHRLAILAYCSYNHIGNYLQSFAVNVTSYNLRKDIIDKIEQDYFFIVISDQLEFGSNYSSISDFLRSKKAIFLSCFIFRNLTIEFPNLFLIRKKGLNPIITRYIRMLLNDKKAIRFYDLVYKYKDYCNWIPEKIKD